MREEQITFEEFSQANRGTQVIHLVDSLTQLGPLARARLEGISECWRIAIEHTNDLDVIRRAHLVRYKPNSQGDSGWEYAGSVPYTVEEYASVLSNANPSEYASISDLAQSMEKALLKDIVLVAAHDIGLNKRIIVDGVHRSTGLVLLSNRVPGCLIQLLAGGHKVSIVELRSRWAHVLYPCDFLEFHRKAPNAFCHIRT